MNSVKTLDDSWPNMPYLWYESWAEMARESGQKMDIMESGIHLYPVG